MDFERESTSPVAARDAARNALVADHTHAGLQNPPNTSVAWLSNRVDNDERLSSDSEKTTRGEKDCSIDLGKGTVSGVEKRPANSNPGRSNSTWSFDNLKEKNTPQNEPPYHVFTTRKKKQLMYIVALAGLFSPLSSNIYFPALGAIAQVRLTVSNEF
jgi:hypothetical protein